MRSAVRPLTIGRSRVMGSVGITMLFRHLSVRSKSQRGLY
jgi:hypothetical protein